jgi:hypothetical protein
MVIVSARRIKAEAIALGETAKRGGTKKPQEMILGLWQSYSDAIAG